MKIDKLKQDLDVKKYFTIILTFTFCFVFFKGSYGQELKTEKIAEVNMTEDPPTEAGTKIIYPITGGTITGKINGKFLPIGADFGTLISPTNFRLDVRGIIQTVDSVTIYVTFTGYIYSDFGTLISPTTFKLDVRVIIQTVDSATIYVTFTGFIHADAETFELLSSDKAGDVSPDKYYFRVNPIFETTSAKYDWLNHTITIGIGTVTENGVSYEIYAVK